MQFGLHLVRAGALTADEFVEIVDRQLRARPTLGELAIETRKLSMRQVFAILSAQTVAHKPFGEIAVEQGYLSRSEIMELLALQVERCRSFFDVIAEVGTIDRATLDQHIHEYRASALEQSMNLELVADEPALAARGAPRG